MSDERLRAADLIGELAEAVHQTGLIRDHSDPTDRTGWHVKGIETCADALCVDALALRAALATPDPAPDPVLDSAYSFALIQIKHDGEVINRLTRALRVATHKPHDNTGPTDPDSGFPTCSDCGAILAATPDPAPCLDHDPNGGPGSDWCPNCGQFATPDPAPDVDAAWEALWDDLLQRFHVLTSEDRRWLDRHRAAIEAALAIPDPAPEGEAPDLCPTCSEPWPCHHGHLVMEHVRYALSALYPWQSGPTNASDAAQFAAEYARLSEAER